MDDAVLKIKDFSNGEVTLSYELEPGKINLLKIGMQQAFTLQLEFRCASYPPVKGALGQRKRKEMMSNTAIVATEKFLSGYN